MAGMSVGGLVSGMDTATIVNQLMQIEANPQTLLKQQLSSTQSQATAFRAINTRFDALRTAAEALTKPVTWDAVKATTSATSVTAVTAPGASAGTVRFDVDNVATAHAVISTATWTATGTQTAFDLDYGATSLDVTIGGVAHSVALDRNGDGTATLAEAAAAINAKKELGLTATAVKVSPTEYRLQVAATKTGAASEFTIDTFGIVTQGKNAQITVGDGTAKYTMSSATNTFTGLVDGTTITVSAPATGVTLNVSNDPEAVAAKVQSLVTAANGLLDAISSYTDPTSSSASLKSNSTLRQLSTRVLDVLARAVGTDGSSSQVGLELTQGGRFQFDKEAFVEKLSADPLFAQRMFTQMGATGGPDKDLATLEDNGTAPVGIAAKLLDIAKTASDTTTGTLAMLAKSSDSRAKDLQDRIDAWDRRLELRRSNLTRQFTAMETALSTLQNQSTWLAASLAQLPGASKPSS
ncbi:UNVERIFIED_ORG: hypothetical protein E4P37_18765 [Bacillus sp. AZ43]